MVGMLQIITYLLALYLVMKGIEIFQIALASNSPDRKVALIIGVISIAVCLIAGFIFVTMQDEQAKSVGTPPAPFTSPY